MIEEFFCRTPVVGPSVQPGMPPDREIDQFCFPFRFKYRVERCIDRIAPDFSGRELLRQSGSTNRLDAQL
jgi:hypothetical protein